MENYTTLDTSCITNWEKAKNNIFPALLNKEENEELLKQVPHSIVGDLAMVYRVSENISEIISEKASETGSTLITNELLTMWNVTETDVFLCSEFPPCFVGTFDQYGLHDNSTSLDEAMTFADDCMYMVRTDNSYGAIALCDSSVLKKVSEGLGNFYIIPSSIHEILILSDNGMMEEEELNEQVRYTNADALEEGEYLSDHVYYYDAEQSALLMGKDGEFIMTTTDLIY